MATAEEGIATQIRNIEARYGKTMAQWSAIVAASGLTRHQDVVALLKTEHGLPHGAAHRVSLTARQQASHNQASPGQASPTTTPEDPVSALYTGRKAALRPLHEELMTAIRALGDDIEIAPKKGYLSLRRGRQFAMIQPSGAGRIDVGLILPATPAAPATPATPAGPRLESAAGFNALFTHRVRLSAGADIDPGLTGWLRLAYQHAAR
ncbi:MAG TPA: DUF5655 domain-containing protein [Streptosporangiaceae bacterium]|nr:DUF5655 domain-containing protein [Streptosporangiaceae bacterium]